MTTRTSSTSSDRLNTFIASFQVSMALECDKGKAAEILFRAFKEGVTNIIRDLPNDIIKPGALEAI
jgi:hypothetical protein